MTNERKEKDRLNRLRNRSKIRSSMTEWKTRVLYKPGPANDTDRWIVSKCSLLLLSRKPVKQIKHRITE